MSVYLDASVLVALFTEDALSERATKAVRQLTDDLVVSDYASLEFSSSLARMGRSKNLTGAKVQEAFADFDTWVAGAAYPAYLDVADVTAALAFVRRAGLSLRGPDALNIAIAQRLDAALLTFDAKMKAAGAKLGLRVV